MHTASLVFSQVMSILDPTQLSRCVARYPMARASRGFSARDQFLSIAFAQITFRESLLTSRRVCGEVRTCMRWVFAAT